MSHLLRRSMVAGAVGVLLLATPAAAHDASVSSWELVGTVGVSTDEVAVRARVALGVPQRSGVLEDLAAAVAERVPGVDAGRLSAAWSATGAVRRTVVLTALAQVGKPYAFGGAGPLVFDCSGLTRFAWRAGGVSLSHYTGLQRYEVTPVALAALQPGDLVFNLGSDGDGHVMLYLGADKAVVDSPATGTFVRVRQYATTTGSGSPLR